MNSAGAGGNGMGFGEAAHALRGLRWASALGALLLLAACGGPGGAVATAIPASVARPEQSTPVFSTAEPLFRLESTTQPPVLITPTAPSTPADFAAVPTAGANRAALLAALLMNQPPSAMGITRGGATLLESPGGSAVTSVPGATTVTVTGRSADGNWLAVFTRDALSGWVPAGSLVLYGADDLGVVESAFSPAPVATMLAEAMVPVTTPLAEYFADLTRTPEPAPELPPAATPVPQAAGDAAVASVEEAGSTGDDVDIAGSAGASPLLGVIAATGNLNLRASPDTDGAVLLSIPAQAEVVVLGRTQAGDWLRVRTPGGDGWVAANFVELDGEVDSLPVVQ